MLQKISLRVFLSLATLGIAACSDDYTPKPNVTGKLFIWKLVRVAILASQKPPICIGRLI